MRVLTRSRPQVGCPRCGVAYRPSLTAGTCPVCGTRPPGAQAHRPRAWEGSDDRLLAIVVVATIANVLLLSLLAVLVLRAV